MENSSNLPEVVVEPTTDIVGKDATTLQAYMEAGMPDVGSVDQEGLKRMFDMYLSGKNYRQISGIMRTKREIVMFYSHKLQWFDKRREYVKELETNMKNRIIEVRLMSQDVMLQFIQNCNRKFTKKLNSQANGNEEPAAQINLKEYEIYLKTQALLLKSVETPAPKGPLVGINVGEGATLTRTGDNTIEVTPKQKAVGEMLDEYLALQKETKK